MRVIITTVYNSNNFGSYLQAKELYEYIKSQGNEVALFDSRTRSMWNTLLKHIKKIAVNTKSIKHTLHGAFFEFLETIKLSKCWKSLPHTRSTENYDLMILGSDEIWNIKRSKCRYPIYWGHGFDGRKIAYAPSCNQATKDDFQKYPKFVDYLNEIDNISVRDLASYNTLIGLTNKTIDVVLDPTLLCDAKTNNFHIVRPYIAVYLFDVSITKDDIQDIREFARNHNCILISAGQYMDWCDKSAHSINGNPFYIFEKADYVITNTFHGTAYSINYRKQFFSIASSRKVQCLLDEFELGNRLVTNTKEMESISHVQIDYKKIELLLKEKRKYSYGFIKEALF